MTAHSKAGFQGSEATSGDFTIYSHADDDVLAIAQSEKLVFTGRNELGSAPVLLGFSTSQKLGAPLSWSVDVKAPFDLGESLVDDDWVDLVMRRRNRPFHIVRGLITDFRETVAASGTGATSRSWSIMGKDWSSIFDKSPIWFNKFAAENAGGSATIDLAAQILSGGSPDATVKTILFGFLETLAGLGRANWEMPPSMPGATDDIRDEIVFQNADFSDSPARVVGTATTFLDPNGVNLWAFAQEWADPTFGELYPDLIPFTGLGIPEFAESEPGASAMTLMYRDRPFVDLSGPHPRHQSLWFQLPTTEVPLQHLNRKDVGRGGLERFNAFLVSPQMAENVGSIQALHAPLWDPKGIRRHGLRRFEVDSRYTTVGNDLFTMASEQRERVRDWHCLNPYLYNGTLSLARLYPEIHVGTRIRIVGDHEVETYYVEQVSHSWRAGSKGTTSVGVTRGWRGSDDDYIRAIEQQVSRYRLADIQLSK